MNKKTYKVTMEVSITVRNFRGEEGSPLPTREQVAHALSQHFDGELLSYKELAESGLLNAAVDTEIHGFTVKG